MRCLMNRRMAFAAVAMFVAMPVASAVAQSAAQATDLPANLTEESLRKQIADWQRRTKQWQNSYIRSLNVKMRRENDPEKKQKVREKIERIRSTAGKVILIPPLDRETSKPGDVGQLLRPPVLRKSNSYDRQFHTHRLPNLQMRWREACFVTKEIGRHKDPRTGELRTLRTVVPLDVRPFTPEGIEIVNDLDPKTNDLGRSFDERKRKQATAEESP